VWFASDAVRRNPLTTKASEVEVEERIKSWLRGAVDRNGGHTARLKKSLEKKARVVTPQPQSASSPLSSSVEN
jgi:hypothetical protein